MDIGKRVFISRCANRATIRAEIEPYWHPALSPDGQKSKTALQF